MIKSMSYTERQLRMFDSYANEIGAALGIAAVIVIVVVVWLKYRRR